MVFEKLGFMGINVGKDCVPTDAGSTNFFGILL